MSFKLSERSLKKLNECDRALRALFKEVATRLPYGPIKEIVVTCGHRTLEEQRELYHKKNSPTRTMKSKHLYTPSLAVDVAIWDTENNDIDWDNGNKKGIYPYLSCLVKDVAGAMDIPVEWGGDWKTIVDMVHWQLPDKSSPSRVFPPPEKLETTTDIIGSIMADIENIENKLRKLQQMEAKK